jgi:hypothetical protein
VPFGRELVSVPDQRRGLLGLQPVLQLHMLGRAYLQLRAGQLPLQGELGLLQRLVQHERRLLELEVQLIRLARAGATGRGERSRK